MKKVDLTDLKILDKLRMGATNPQKVPGFVPSQDALMQLNTEQIKRMFIKRVEHAKDQLVQTKLVASLTFVFQDDSRSPPAYTHSHEPNKYFMIPAE